MAVTKYETVFVAEPGISTEQVDALLDKIKGAVASHQGSVHSEDRWGLRRLAYSIKGHREGFYAVVNFAAEPAAVTALEHLFNVTGSVLRHVTVRHWEPSKNKKVPAPRERPAGTSESPRGPGRSRGASRTPPESGPRPVEPPGPAALPGEPAPPVPVPGASRPEGEKSP